MRGSDGFRRNADGAAPGGEDRLAPVAPKRRRHRDQGVRPLPMRIGKEDARTARRAPDLDSGKADPTGEIKGYPGGTTWIEDDVDGTRRERMHRVSCIGRRKRKKRRPLVSTKARQADGGRDGPAGFEDNQPGADSISGDQQPAATNSWKRSTTALWMRSFASRLVGWKKLTHSSEPCFFSRRKGEEHSLGAIDQAASIHPESSVERETRHRLDTGCVRIANRPDANFREFDGLAGSGSGNGSGIAGGLGHVGLSPDAEDFVRSGHDVAVAAE